MSDPTIPEFLVIGHITKDLTNGSFTIGGTVTYAALTACRLGCRTGIVTRADPELDLTALEGCGIHITRLPSPVTTTFENIYLDGTRRQYVRAVANTISPEDIPLAWRRAPIVHLGPLAQELPPDLVHAFPHALIGITPQGWMRRWDATGLVHPIPWEHLDQVMDRADVLVYSEQDVDGDRAIMQRYAHVARIMVVTQSRRGCTVYVRGQRPRHFPAYPAVEVDPTGAGDVFCAAYLIHLYQTRDPYESARFANCVASFCVEGKGTSCIPSLAQVQERLRQGHGRRLPTR